MQNKEIVFKSKSMKKLFDNKPDDVKREALPTVPVTLQTIKSQYELLCSIHYNLESVAADENTQLLIRELNAKMNGYKQQDIKKNMFDEKAFITIEQIRAKLIDETMTCTFCNKQVKLLYDIVRDEMQWTLDRIDNDIGHSNENTKIACLKCNLKRRTTNYDKFHWTKNLTISKME